MDDYTVELPVFHGPLDLLLYLVKRNELAILDVGRRRIERQILDRVIRHIAPPASAARSRIAPR